MSRGTTQKPSSANLTPAQMQAAIARLEALIEELKNLDVATITDRNDQAVQSLKAKISSTLASIFGEHSPEYARLRSAADLYRATNLAVLPGNPFSPRRPTGPPLEEIRAGFDRGRNNAVALLEGEVYSLKEVLRYAAETIGEVQPEGPAIEVASDEIFIVHGHDAAAKNEVKNLIQLAGLNPVILHEQPNSGRTIIEKFERYGRAAGFAVVLLTPDDVGGPNCNELRLRARQNVVGELFWFAGKLGRERVCALKKGDLEIPSDFAGIVYTEMDVHGAWKTELLRELRAAGYTVDLEKALGIS
jgi:predicted nucleotide-binding protein